MVQRVGICVPTIQRGQTLIIIEVGQQAYLLDDCLNVW